MVPSQKLAFCGTAYAMTDTEGFDPSGTRCLDNCKEVPHPKTNGTVHDRTLRADYLARRHTIRLAAGLLAPASFSSSPEIHPLGALWE